MATRRDELMIRRRVRGGANERQSRELLRKLKRQHGPTTLPAALAHHGFISRGQAEKMS